MPILKISALAAVATLAATAAGAQPNPSRHFLEDALKGDNSEIALGQMAAREGASRGVRAFGETLRRDHEGARAQVLPVAQQAGVPPTDELMPEARQEQRKLERLHGRAFDREFARYMVKDHKKDIAEFQKQARGRGPAADLARQTLPTLRKHLAMAQRLSRG